MCPADLWQASGRCCAVGERIVLQDRTPPAGGRSEGDDFTNLTLSAKSCQIGDSAANTEGQKFAEPLRHACSSEALERHATRGVDHPDDHDDHDSQEPEG